MVLLTSSITRHSRLQFQTYCDPSPTLLKKQPQTYIEQIKYCSIDNFSPLCSHSELGNSPPRTAGAKDPRPSRSSVPPLPTPSSQASPILLPQIPTPKNPITHVQRPLPLQTLPTRETRQRPRRRQRRLPFLPLNRYFSLVFPPYPLR